jgi:hypothetical protein
MSFLFTIVAAPVVSMGCGCCFPAALARAAVIVPFFFAVAVMVWTP